MSHKSAGAEGPAQSPAQTLQEVLSSYIDKSNFMRRDCREGDFATLVCANVQGPMFLRDRRHYSIMTFAVA